MYAKLIFKISIHFSYFQNILYIKNVRIWTFGKLSIFRKILTLYLIFLVHRIFQIFGKHHDFPPLFCTFSFFPSFFLILSTDGVRYPISHVYKAPHLSSPPFFLGYKSLSSPLKTKLYCDFKTAVCSFWCLFVLYTPWNFCFSIHYIIVTRFLFFPFRFFL